MAWLNLTMSSQTVKNGLKAKKNKLLQMKFFFEKQLKFSCTYWPFHCEKFKKSLVADPELWRCTIFASKMVHFSQTIFFFKTIYIILIYLFVPFIPQNLKKFLPADPELWRAIFGPEMAHFPKWEFFQLSHNIIHDL